ncbi:MAG: hypothetical protein K9W45_05245 [Candidatus Heimdallarchaeum aukensis]|uniref:Uncharacterized protein n=2 Tax=Candidatus Heimdallarchaeum TaxID=3053649 RepID=A0A9Y1BTT7_9ARCH|nr:MAG: hypothetical protein K9W45_05245 [Candidatus Heimdallarchaeum aukensis]UJG44690.1 MAG: hypothetical protein K9W46_05790 [Candidatus Heimdallarchaeum endolithica]
MKTSLKPNEKRVKQRRKEVMEAAYRARNFTVEQLTKEASNFIKFALSLKKTKIIENNSKDD